MARCSFVWLLVGFAAGGLMLTDQTLAGEWRRWLLPTHGHMLFVGWFVQFALGIAYWLLPRRRTPERPLGYRLGPAYAAVAALNLGLLLRAVAEPAERAGHGGGWTEPVYAASALLQVGAVVVLVAQLWPRLAPRPAKSNAGKRQSD
jgi:hypothetical protein